MTLSKNPLPVYLDQNVLSGIREGEPTRQGLMDLLKVAAEQEAIFVYSMVHVEECRASDQPERFVQVLEELSAYLLESTPGSDQSLTLSLGRARELILAEPDVTDQAQRVMENLLKPLHLAAGWLSGVEISELKEQMAREVDDFWASLEQNTDLSIFEPDMRSNALRAFRMGREGMLQIVRDLPIQQLKDESEQSSTLLRIRLPENLAQLDEMPAEDVAFYIISCLEKKEKKGIQDQFPQGFWSNTASREEGALSGFAFMLFMCGLIRDKRVRTRGRVRREKHFLGQFRDCLHIENAARCAIFVTFDKGAARLAKAAYSYADVQTEILHLATKKV